jgi:hypothetical protein
MTVLDLLKLSSIDYVVILNDFVHMYISISESMYCSYCHAVVSYVSITKVLLCSNYNNLRIVLLY